MMGSVLQYVTIGCRWRRQDISRSGGTRDNKLSVVVPPQCVRACVRACWLLLVGSDIEGKGLDPRRIMRYEGRGPALVVGE